VSDLVSVIGTTGTGFLQNDACWRELPRLGPDELRAPYYLQLVVDDRPGVLADVAARLAAEEVSVARLLQEQGEGEATLHVVTHDARLGSVRAALAAIEAVPGTRRPPSVLLVVADDARRPS
jgi:homoserine dehydrogenase